MLIKNIIENWIKPGLNSDEYYMELEKRIEGYALVYKDKPAKIARRLFLWNMFQLFFSKKTVIDKKENTAKPDNALLVAFIPTGGIGDNIIFANYLAFFKEKFNNVIIDIFPANKSADCVFEDNYLIRKLVYEKDLRPENEDYDLVIGLMRYPEIMYADYERVRILNQQLLDYIFLCREFRISNPRFFISGPSCDGQSAYQSLLSGRRRINQSDIFDFLGVNEYKYRMPSKVQEKDVLQKFGLKRKKYITIHRGWNMDHKKHVQLWPMEYYNKVILKIKKAYPYITIVQIGADELRCPAFDNIDVSLVGRTSMEEMKWILKNSFVHIDGEGGLVHLRYAMKGGTSVVLFGPTNPDFFGYKENVNIIGEGCNCNCEWLTDSWIDYCAAGYEEAKCMKSIKPDIVFRAVEKYFEKEWSNE